MHVIGPGAGGPDGVRLIDTNGDGLEDVVSAYEQAGLVTVFQHPGVGQVTNEWPFIIFGGLARGEDAFGWDLDEDGAIDIISSHEGDTLQIFVHWAPSDPAAYRDARQWQHAALPSSAGISWMFSDVIDVNNDGHYDIVAGSKTDLDRDTHGEIGWFEAPKENPRDMTQWTYHKIDDAGWIMSLIPYDVDKDTDQDIVVTDRDADAEHQGGRWLENPGADWEQEWRSRFLGDLSGGLRPTFMDIGDLNDDDADDFIIPVENVGVNNVKFLQRSNFTEAPTFDTYPIDFAPPEGKGTLKGVAAGDIDMDGVTDLVVSFENAGDGKHGVGWLSYISSPYDAVWQWHNIADERGQKFDLVELYDVDLDGDLDVLTTEEVDGLGVIWYENPTIDN